MKYAEAFQKLGYQLEVPRLDWSAANDSGVCLSLWRCEINWKTLSIDTRFDAGPTSTWNAAGNNKRKQHIAKAMSEFGGWIDVVVVDGTPGKGVDKASVWNSSERDNRRWRVLEFDPVEGHFRAKALSAPQEQG